MRTERWVKGSNSLVSALYWSSTELNEDELRPKLKTTRLDNKIDNQKTIHLHKNNWIEGVYNIKIISNCTLTITFAWNIFTLNIVKYPRPFSLFFYFFICLSRRKVGSTWTLHMTTWCHGKTYTSFSPYTCSALIHVQPIYMQLIWLQPVFCWYNFFCL